MSTRLIWLAALVPLACSSNSISPEQACADLARAVCTERDTCSNDLDNSRAYGTEAVCESRMGSSCIAGLAVHGTAATPEDREACAKAYGSDETCSEYFENDPAAACDPPAGAAAMGATCAVAAQCASAFCAIAQDQVCGTCQSQPVAGASCTVDADCGRDLACATPAGSASGVCATWVEQGGACLTGVNPCAPQLACMGDDVATATHGSCVATITTVGSACDSSRKTAPPCDGAIGLACIPAGSGTTIGTCQAIAIVGAGEMCGNLGGPPITSVAECGAGGMCVKATATAHTGMCVAPAAEGAPCDRALGPPCLEPAKCVAGTCTLPFVAACL
jgi:hypothetical protein